MLTLGPIQIDWFITTPLLLTDLFLTCGLPMPTILYTILFNEVMVVTGLVGALVRTSYKWGRQTETHHNLNHTGKTNKIDRLLHFRDRLFLRRRLHYCL